MRWLRDRDANTKFFHQSTLQRRRRNKILKLKDEQGRWVEQPNWICELVVNHFAKLFKSDGPRVWGSLLDCINPTISLEMNQMLVEPVSDEEIKDVVMQIGG